MTLENILKAYQTIEELHEILDEKKDIDNPDARHALGKLNKDYVEPSDKEDKYIGENGDYVRSGLKKARKEISEKTQKEVGSNVDSVIERIGNDLILGYLLSIKPVEDANNKNAANIHADVYKAQKIIERGNTGEIKNFVIKKTNPDVYYFLGAHGENHVLKAMEGIHSYMRSKLAGQFMAGKEINRGMAVEYIKDTLSKQDKKTQDMSYLQMAQVVR